MADRRRECNRVQASVTQLLWEVDSRLPDCSGEEIPGKQMVLEIEINGSVAGSSYERWNRRTDRYDVVHDSEDDEKRMQASRMQANYLNKRMQEKTLTTSCHP